MLFYFTVWSTGRIPGLDCTLTPFTSATPPNGMISAGPIHPPSVTPTLSNQTIAQAVTAKSLSQTGVTTSHIDFIGNEISSDCDEKMYSDIYYSTAFTRLVTKLCSDEIDSEILSPEKLFGNYFTP